jgi:Aminoglycoside adenylyltransferase, C-terminal domain
VSGLSVYLDELGDRVSATLRGRLLGVYLHGSAAMNAFVASRSDVDLLAVTTSPVPTEAKLALADRLSSSTLPCPGVGLEMSLVTSLSARTPSDAPAFELHIDTAEEKVVDGLGHPGDPDLVAHFAMARTRGWTLLGPSPAEIFAPVARSRLLRCLADDLAWGLEHRLAAYTVLNACRALRFATEGGLYSKLEGGEWALDEGIGEKSLIVVALRRQRGADESVDFERAAVFVADVHEILLAAVRNSR